MGRKSREQIEAEAAEKTAAMTQSPEFKKAVADSVTSALAELMPQLSAARQSAGTASESGDRSLMQELAMAISQLTDQGSGRSRVAPEIIQQRADARKRMTDLIIEAYAEGKVATYQLRNKIHVDDRIIEPFWIRSDHTSQPTEIDYPGIPNEAMVPMNDTAKAIFGAFKDSIGSVHAGKGKDGHMLPEMERLGITPKGVVVRNSAVSQSAARATPAGRDAVPMQWEDGKMPAYEAPQVNGDVPVTVKIHHENTQGRYVDKHILGTIQTPARQTA
jgi:hypothetical protein